MDTIIKDNEFKNVFELTCSLHLLPKDVALDTLKRIIDWTYSGGDYDDEYVKKQLKYASNFIKREGE